MGAKEVEVAKEVEAAKEVAKGAALKEVVLVEQVPSEGYVWLLGTETAITLEL